MDIRAKQINDVKMAFQRFPLDLEISAVHERDGCDIRQIDVRCNGCKDTAPISVNVYDDGLEKSNHQAQLQLMMHMEKYHKN